MKIIVIDLLNKIANSEEVPKMFKYNDKIWRLASNRTYFIGNDYGYDFWVEHGNDKFEDEIITLNDEIEIIEEEKKIPERVLSAEVFDVPKLNNMELSNIALTNKEDIKIIKDTLNKILDYLKSKGDE